MSDIAPPPYESVVQSFVVQNDSKDFSIHRIDSFAASITSDQKLALADSPKLDPNALDPKEVEAFKQKVREHLDDPATIEKFKQTARDSVTACKKIDDMFSDLYATIAKIDTENGLADADKFLPAFSLIQNAWRQLIRKSRALAADVAVSAKRFDEVIMPVAADKTMAKETKLEIIKQALSNSMLHKKSASDIESEVTRIADDFSKFVGTFNNWGKKKEGAINQQIETINDEVKNLVLRLGKLRDELIGFGVATGVGLAIAAGGLWVGPWAPVFFAVGGLIAFTFGVALITTGIQYAEVKAEIERKNSEIEGLRQTVTNITAARASLTKAGDADVKLMREHVTAATGVWRNLVTDTEQICQWIEGGQKYQDNDKLSPSIQLYLIQGELSHATAIYSKIGDYLTEYSNGMIGSGIPDPK